MRQRDYRLDPDPSVVKKVRRQILRCAYCPPNRGENAVRRAKHGTRPPRAKNHRHGAKAR